MSPNTRFMLPFSFSLAAVAFAVPAQAADFYAGKSVKIVVSSNTGGGYDTYSRVLSRHLGRHLPGNPGMIVQNMPGGGGHRSAQFVYTAAPKDGTVLGNVRASAVMDAILGIRSKDMDANKFDWIGSMAADTDVCSFWHTSGIKTFDDLKKKEVVIGASGKGAQAYSFPNAMNRVLGTKFKIVLGYKGAADRILALEQGELQGNCGINGSTITSSWPQLLSQGKLIPVVQSGIKPYPALPNVPLTQSFAETDEQRNILEAIFSQMQIARAYAFPPGTDDARVKEMRAAFAAAVTDPRLLADAKRTKIDIDPTVGEETQKLMAKLASMDPGIRAKVKAAIGQ